MTLPDTMVRRAEQAIARGDYRSLDEWMESAVAERDTLWFSRDVTQRVVVAYEQAIAIMGQFSKRTAKSKVRTSKQARQIRDCGCKDVEKITSAARDSSDEGGNIPIRNCAACIDHCVRRFQANLTEIQLTEPDGSVPGDLAALAFEVFAECLHLCAYYCHRDLGNGAIQ